MGDLSSPAITSSPPNFSKINPSTTTAERAGQGAMHFFFSKFLICGDRAGKRNEYYSCQPSKTQKTSTIQKTIKTNTFRKPVKSRNPGKTVKPGHKTSNIQKFQYPTAGSLCGFTTLLSPYGAPPAPNRHGHPVLTAAIEERKIN